MQKLKIDFSDFYHGFDKRNNYFYQLLSGYYDLEISSDPEILIYSNYGKTFLEYSCLRIFYTAENISPNFNECDFAFTFDLMTDPRNYRLPNYFFWITPKLTALKNADFNGKEKQKFCCFVVSNPDNPVRNKFYHALSKYKKIDSGGKHLNNIGYVVKRKLDFIKDYKFVIAFENSSYPGYTTEKIIEPFLAGSIPVYWGNPVVDREFNEDSFVNCHRYRNFRQVIEQIKKIDTDDALFRQYIQSPCFIGNKIPASFHQEAVLKRFIEIIENRTNRIPVGISRKNYRHIRNFKDLMLQPLVLILPLGAKRRIFSFYRRFTCFFRSVMLPGKH
jgi:alpha(1,3/1,4) fucosyltransferase